MIRAAIVFASLCLAACVNAGGVVHNDRGGYLSDYLERRSQMIESGTPAVFSGYVYSAATALITVPGSCTYPDATFGFHGAFVGSVHDPIGTMLLGNTYSVPLQAWYYSSGASQMIGNDMLYLSAADLVEMGALEFCET